MERIAFLNKNPKRWDLWWADVAYEEHPGSKIRPVLIYNCETAYIISFKITTHPPRPYDDGEYLINLWEEAGLNRRSTVRCSKKLCLTELDMVEKIGELHPTDIKEVRKILQRMYAEE